MKNKTMVVVTLTAAWWVATAQAQPPKAGDKPAAAPPAAPPAAPGGAPAAPGGAPPSGPPKPAPENEVIKKSAGTWRCEGTMKRPDGQEVKYKSTWTIKPTLGGHWYALGYKRAKSGPMPSFEGQGTVGYDVTAKKYLFVAFDDHGSWLDLGSSDGAVFSGDGAVMGRKTPVKFSFAAGKDKKGQESDKLFDLTMDFGGPTASESCKK
jgi:hypothetical protein